MRLPVAATIPGPLPATWSELQAHTKLQANGNKLQANANGLRKQRVRKACQSATGAVSFAASRRAHKGCVLAVLVLNLFDFVFELLPERAPLPLPWSKDHPHSVLNVLHGYLGDERGTFSVVRFSNIGLPPPEASP